MIIKDNRGFTLIEVLVVLIVLSIFIGLGFTRMKPIWRSLEKGMFISQMEADLYFVQAYAVNRHESVVVQFYPFNDRYIATSVTSNSKILDRTLPTSIDMMNGSFTSYTITPDGNINKFGTLKFKHSEKELKLIFNIGRGRFRIEEQ
ncbi:competence type IV pilus minor pilin ComGD [Heyndrickxia vini]|uniref:Prepilin-type N-terminal cleavage/methylation domain-containing protein n=1 Tax=Heyndrickxia vini TaxID=1476025 RepID=A0ABX7E7R6_9BACI|nr:competence type IV pilus minor pilin ComGD [Heyndrickxia vini]QQZ10872.1 prepilin-type N-terminal cleavage/methylation domain-containing protein [Heyndrickxia vini]